MKTRCTIASFAALIGLLVLPLRPAFGQSAAIPFYPGVTRREQASPISLEPGMNMEGLVIELLDVPIHAVRGALLNVLPAPNV